MYVTPLYLVARVFFAAVAVWIAGAHKVHTRDYYGSYDYEPVGAEETGAEESVGSAVAEARSFPFGDDGFGVSEGLSERASASNAYPPSYAPSRAPAAGAPSPPPPDVPAGEPPLPDTPSPPPPDVPVEAPPLPNRPWTWPWLPETPQPPPSSPDEPSSPPPPPLPPPHMPQQNTENEKEAEDIASLPIVRKYDEFVMRSMDDEAYTPGDWLLGRATYFDAPETWKQTFNPHKFGDLYGNGCGYIDKSPGIESNQNFPYAFDAVAAVADFDPRLYEGACGSCFEIKCVTGPVLSSYDQNDKIEYVDVTKFGGFYEQAPGALDTFGRAVPKRNAETFGGVDDDSDTAELPYEAEYARCWNESNSIFVKIVDKCPCSYFYEQTICCGPIPHFDLSYWAHEKLLHPVQGKAMIRFRPVTCDDKVPVDARLGAAARMNTNTLSIPQIDLSKADLAGQRVARFGGSAEQKVIQESNSTDENRTVFVFSNGPAPGWLISAYGDRYVTLFTPDMGMSRISENTTTTNVTLDTYPTTNATCALIKPGGRLLVRCEACEQFLKPFGGNDARVVSFFVRVGAYVAVDSNVTDKNVWQSSINTTGCENSTRVPNNASINSPLYLGVSNTGAYDFVKQSAPNEKPCGVKTFVEHDGACGVRVVVSLKQRVKCFGRAAERANSVFLELGNANEKEHAVCVDDMFVASTE